MRFHGNEEKTGVGSWKKYALQAILLPFVFQFFIPKML